MSLQKLKVRKGKEGDGEMEGGGERSDVYLLRTVPMTSMQNFISILYFNNKLKNHKVTSVECEC